MPRGPAFALLFVFAAAAALSRPLPAAAQADTGDGASILGDKEVKSADVATFQAEADLLETIRKGIVLSLALCEAGKPCQPSVNRDELHRIIDKVEERIDVLTARHDQTNDTSLEPVMLAYVDVRDNYTKVLDELTKLVPEGQEGPGLGKNLNDIFKDADEALGDDENPGKDSFESGAPQ